LPEIKSILQNFDYNFEDWYNHLKTNKQKEIDNIDPYNIKLDNSYEMFVKSEKQLYEQGKAPKNRCICSPQPEHKYVMGPITWKLAEIFDKFLKDIADLKIGHR
jgi:hypothetical protein